MKIINVALTGGPGGGKTSVLKAINGLITLKNENIIELASKKIKLITVPETATELISNGINPNEALDVLDFQNILFSIQKAKEEASLNAIKFNYDTDMCMFIYDRGLLDGMAYLKDKNEFNKILFNNNTNEINLLDKYDIVIDLLSTATCAEEKYGFESNASRFEDTKWAKKVDSKTTNAWLGHRNLKIFDSSVPLDEEIDQVINYLKDYILNGQAIVNNEYRVEVDPGELYMYNDENSRKISICDTEIDYGLGDIVNTVLTKRTYKNNSTYFLKFITDTEDEKRIIKEEMLDLNKYNELLLRYKKKNQVKRDELSFFYNKVLYKLSFFEDFTTMSFESSKEDMNINLPMGIEIIDNHQKKLEKKIEYGNI